jgi:cobalt/nickel transport system ATP-binding protein
MVILEARGLRFRYPGGLKAIDGLSLAVEKGETLAILGPNGAGKTTVLLHLGGHLRPERGEVLLAGEPVGYDQRSLTAWRRKVGLMLQDPDDQLFAGTVFEDVSFGPLNLGLDEQEVRVRVGRALADLRIEDLAERPIHMLSLGQKRRVAIAGLVAMTPAVLLLDEPTAGLDPQGISRLLETLRRLSGFGMTVVYSTHNVDLALAWSDRVALFAGGRTIACGPADRTLADPELLHRAHLRRPLLLDFGLRARQLGLLGDDEPIPRTSAEMLGALERIAERR